MCSTKYDRPDYGCVRMGISYFNPVPTWRLLLVLLYMDMCARPVRSVCASTTPSIGRPAATPSGSLATHWTVPGHQGEPPPRPFATTANRSKEEAISHWPGHTSCPSSSVLHPPLPPHRLPDFARDTACAQYIGKGAVSVSVGRRGVGTKHLVPFLQSAPCHSLTPPRPRRSFA